MKNQLLYSALKSHAKNQRFTKMNSAITSMIHCQLYGATTSMKMNNRTLYSACSHSATPPSYHSPSTTSNHRKPESSLQQQANGLGLLVHGGMGRIWGLRQWCFPQERRIYGRIGQIWAAGTGVDDTMVEGGRTNSVHDGRADPFFFHLSWYHMIQICLVIHLF